MVPQRKAFLFAMAAVLLWSTVATAFKLSLVYLSPLQLLFYANLSSIVTLLMLLGIEGRLSELRRLTVHDLTHGILLGILNPFLYYLVLFQAYDMLPAQVAQPLNYTWAITLSLLSAPLLGHRLTRNDLTSILVSYSGVVLILTRGDITSFEFDSLLGTVLALFSTIIWALYWIFNARSKVDPAVCLLLNFVSALPFVLACMWATSSLHPVDLKGVAGAVYVGVIEMGVAFVLWLKAMRLTRSTVRIASLIYFAPFFSLVLIHLVVGEQIRVSSILGLLLIVAGNLLQCERKSRSE